MNKASVNIESSGKLLRDIYVKKRQILRATFSFIRDFFWFGSIFYGQPIREISPLESFSQCRVVNVWECVCEMIHWWTEVV